MCSGSGVEVGNVQHINPEMLECIIANTIRNNSPKLFDRLSDDGLISELFPATWSQSGSSEFVLSLKIASREELDSFKSLSTSIGILISISTANEESVLATSLRYIKADIDAALQSYNDEQQSGQERARV